MILVDSSVWIDFMNRRVTPQTLWLRSEQHAETVGLTTFVLAEVLQGIRFEMRFLGAEQYFLNLTIFDTFPTHLAIQSARNFRPLRSRGITVRSTIDCLVATLCIEQGHQLLHSDRDFNAFEEHLGLQVLHPPAAALN